MENKPNDKKNKNIINMVVIGVIAVCVLLFFNFLSAQARESRREEITYNQFLEMLDEGVVKNVLVKNDGSLEITRNDDTAMIPRTYYTGQMSDLTLTDRLEAAGVEFKREIPQSSSMFLTILSWVLPLVLIYGAMFLIFRFMSRGSGGVMGVGKSNAKVYAQKATGVTFKDVAGQEESKESLKEIVDFLHNPAKYTQIGAKLPKGALLVGPPGTGKTLLAKAVAGEAGVPFYSLSGSDFVEMFVGVGASRVRDLFKQAQQSAPCIIFIDELDAIGKSRDSRYGGNDEREQTLNQLLAEMDGFDSSKGIIILAATNRPEILDKALLRPGRFDRRIIVEKPDLKGRIETLKVHSKNVHMDDTVDLHEIGLATSGAVGSDLANIINEAALHAVKHGRMAVSQADLFESVEVVIAGKEKKDRVLSAKERRIVSYHEVGHALTAALQKNTEPVQKITIVPRTMGALGYTMQVPEEEKYLMSQSELEEELVVLFGGRAAEQVKFNSVTTGASNDIERATAIAKAMVTQYGMSDRFGLMGLASVEDQYLSGRTVLNCGDATAAEIDTEVMGILKDAYQKALDLLKDNMDCLDEISDYLIENETITGKEFMQIFRRIKGIPEPEEKKVPTDENALGSNRDNTPESVAGAMKQEQPAGFDVERILDQGMEKNNHPISEETIWPPLKGSDMDSTGSDDLDQDLEKAASKDHKTSDEDGDAKASPSVKD